MHMCPVFLEKRLDNPDLFRRRNNLFLITFLQTSSLKFKFIEKKILSKQSLMIFYAISSLPMAHPYLLTIASSLH